MPMKIPLPSRGGDSAASDVLVQNVGVHNVAAAISTFAAGPTPREGSVISVQSATGGIGVSVFSALLSLALAQKSKRVGLLDEYPTAGGLDVVLGIEEAEGLRWSQVEAPMGHLDPQSFVGELLQWEGIDVLSADPWNGADLQQWEVDAAHQAIFAAEEWTVIDAVGSLASVSPTAGSLDSGSRRVNPSPVDPPDFTIVLVELSILGLARAKALLRTVRNNVDGTAREGEESQKILVIAVPARQACSKAKSLITVEEASVYLESDIFGTLLADARLEKDISAGLGIKEVPKKYAAFFRELIENIERHERTPMRSPSYSSRAARSRELKTLR